MSNKYWITGVQLGMLKSFIDSINVIGANHLIDEIIDKQFIVPNSLERADIKSTCQATGAFNVKLSPADANSFILADKNKSAVSSSQVTEKSEIRFTGNYEGTLIEDIVKEKMKEARRERDKEIAKIITNSWKEVKTCDVGYSSKLLIKIIHGMGYDIRDWLLLLGDFLEPDKTWNDLKELSQE